VATEIVCVIVAVKNGKSRKTVALFGVKDCNARLFSLQLPRLSDTHTVTD